MNVLPLFLLCGLIGAFTNPSNAAYPYYGTKIGTLTQLHHGVSGDVYAVDSRTLFLKNFNYDGEAPAAYFYVGNTNRPSNEGGIRIRDERGSTALLKKYRHKDITLSLPEGKTLRDIKWFSVWCDEFSVNFGDVKIPNSLDFPRPQKLTPLNGVHGVQSDNIVIVDAQTLLVPNFSYDGEAPDAKFWVGRGQKPTASGLRIPDENGKVSPLRQYDHKTIVLTLPGDLTVFDIGHFGVWCEAFTVDFGHIRIPETLNVPPSLKMLGISPQSKLNCEVLYDDLAFEVRWAIAGESIVVQLVGKLEDGEYMSFGISPNPEHTQMIGADVVVAWVDKLTGKGYAYDYYLDAKSQCSGTHGSCPDTRILDSTNSIRLLNAAMVNGYSIVTYQRSLMAADELDLSIPVNASQAIVWAIGPLNQRQEVSFHSKYTKGDQLVNFGRQPTWNCPMPEDETRNPEEEVPSVEEYYDRRPQIQRKTTREPESDRRRPQNSNRITRRPVPTPKPVSTKDAWEIPPIECNEPDDGVFYAQLGPTGGKHGYPAITGHVGWGISWYINGLLIPEINVVRGTTYNFVTEAGNDPEYPAKYHPFYITDDPIGGFEHKTDEEKAGVRIFAGVHNSTDGKITPTGVGRLCNWTPNPDGPPADDYASFGAYQRTLTLKCEAGLPGIIQWTPDKDTPNTVYYQCFTHRYLGWKINVLDSCEVGQESSIDEVYAEPEDEGDFLAEPSIRHETRIRPTDNFLSHHEKDLIKNHNMNEAPPKVQFELTKSAEITKLIADGIRAAEALEESISKSTPNVTIPDQNRLHLPQILEGEINILNTTQVLQDDHFSLPFPSPATFLRPPQNGAIYRPIKLSGRRPTPVQYERRPNNRPQRPVILPQPSVIINHYKKPVSPLMRPFIKTQSFPIKPIASVLLLGQTTELSSQRKNEPILKSKRKPHIPIPYMDSMPQDSKKVVSVVHHGPMHKPVKKPFLRHPAYPEKFNIKQNPFKIPFEISEEIEKDDGIRPAKNTGFQPDSVVVEGGFKPIVRRRKDDNAQSEQQEMEEDQEPEQLTRRQDDYFSENDEPIEDDALFFNEEKQNQYFEPMFIPSPLDSTNSSNIVRKSIQHQESYLSGDLMDMEFEDGDDKMAVAAERVDTYYLPPDNKKPLSLPDGAVVAYDGKAVLDMSLVKNAPPQLRSDNKKKGLSKTEQLMRSTPQFGPFRGEMPPPIPEFLPKDLPQMSFLKSNGHKPQSPVTEYSNPMSGNSSPISTKLTLLSPKN